MQKLLLAVLALLIIVGGSFYFLKQRQSYQAERADQTDTAQPDVLPVESDNGIGDGAEPLPEMIDDSKTVIGKSVDGNDITAYHYGEGSKEVLFIGGIHAGYSGNTTLVAYELMDYLEADPKAVPAGLKVTVIPVMNPDGLKAVYGTTGRIDSADLSSDHSVTTAGRFNAHNVDLNRNFDCEWNAEGTWQNKTVSGGTAPFSEPEAQAIKSYVEKTEPVAAVVWYSAAGGVFSSNCQNGVSTATKELTNRYASASGYKPYEEFNFYEITGDMVNWFAKNRIPAISVLLSDHENPEWNKNRAGIDAILKYLAQ